MANIFQELIGLYQAIYIVPELKLCHQDKINVMINIFSTNSTRNATDWSLRYKSGFWSVGQRRAEKSLQVNWQCSFLLRKILPSEEKL